MTATPTTGKATNADLIAWADLAATFTEAHMLTAALGMSKDARWNLLAALEKAERRRLEAEISSDLRHRLQHRPEIVAVMFSTADDGDSAFIDSCVAYLVHDDGRVEQANFSGLSGQLAERYARVKPGSGVAFLPAAGTSHVAPFEFADLYGWIREQTGVTPDLY